MAPLKTRSAAATERILTRSKTATARQSDFSRYTTAARACTGVSGSSAKRHDPKPSVQPRTHGGRFTKDSLAQLTSIRLKRDTSRADPEVRTPGRASVTIIDQKNGTADLSNSQPRCLKNGDVVESHDDPPSQTPSDSTVEDENDEDYSPKTSLFDRYAYRPPPSPKDRAVLARARADAVTSAPCKKAPAKAQQKQQSKNTSTAKKGKAASSRQKSSHHTDRSKRLSAATRSARKVNIQNRVRAKTPFRSHRTVRHKSSASRSPESVEPERNEAAGVQAPDRAASRGSSPLSDLSDLGESPDGLAIDAEPSDIIDQPPRQCEESERDQVAEHRAPVRPASRYSSPFSDLSDVEDPPDRLAINTKVSEVIDQPQDHYEEITPSFNPPLSPEVEIAPQLPREAEVVDMPGQVANDKDLGEEPLDFNDPEDINEPKDFDWDVSMDEITVVTDPRLPEPLVPNFISLTSPPRPLRPHKQVEARARDEAGEKSFTEREVDAAFGLLMLKYGDVRHMTRQAAGARLEAARSELTSTGRRFPLPDVQFPASRLRSTLR